jgi:hypothetical protein
MCACQAMRHAHVRSMLARVQQRTIGFGLVHAIEGCQILEMGFQNNLFEIPASKFLKGCMTSLDLHEKKMKNSH